MQKSDVLLEIRNIQASYKEYPALNNVSLDIKKIQYLVLLENQVQESQHWRRLSLGFCRLIREKLYLMEKCFIARKSICIASSSVNKFKWYFKIQKVH